jgi:hypothetical protein
MKNFIKSWAANFDDRKYPREFYFDCLIGVQKAEMPNTLAEYLVHMLHWKDGKVEEKETGASEIGAQRYEIKPCKPNTYNEETHWNILSSTNFFVWAKEIQASNSFQPRAIEDLQGNRFQLWKGTSIVIPAFVLHILNPETYPIFDQHVLRAIRVLYNQIEKAGNDKAISIEDYIEYHAFWRDTITTLPYEKPTLEQLKEVDEALWSLGRWIKRAISQPAEHTENGQEINLSQPISKEGVTYTPDRQFKTEVMALVRIGVQQKEAMETVAMIRGVILPPSYLKYPGSHIDRWRKQGH